MREPKHDRIDPWRVGPPLALLALGFSVQAWFFVRFPQPPVFGDAAGYYWAGRQVRAALAALLGGDRLAVALDCVRPILHFLGVGARVALLPSDRGADLPAFRLRVAGS